jgi:hypothetical protein
MSFPSDSATRSRLVKALLADESPLRHAQSGFAAGHRDTNRRHLMRALLQGEAERRSGHATPQLEPSRDALIRALLQRDGGRRSGYDPNQPRVPAGNPDGGQWTSGGGMAGAGGTGAAETNGYGAGARWTSGSDTPSLSEDWAPTDVSDARRRRPRREREPPRDYEPHKEIWQAIQAFRVKHTRDLFEKRYDEGVVACTEINGREVCGSNSRFVDAYSDEDRARARRLRQDLITKYPYIMKVRNVGLKPNVAVYHAETTVLLRAKHENGGSLAGQTMGVFVEDTPCSSCQMILPYVGLEVGNPTVTFISRTGWKRTMRNGRWLD